MKDDVKVDKDNSYQENCINREKGDCLKDAVAVWKILETINITTMELRET